MSDIPFVDLKTQYGSLKPEMDRAILDVVDRCAFIGGPAVDAFEKAFAAFCGTKHAVGVSSGTSAIQLALQALDVGPGDEVITVADTFIATASAITGAGARPVIVDCDPVTRNIDPAGIEAAITPKTKAIVPVHLYGLPADMDPILDIAKRHGLRVVEDAAQAHGARYKGRRVGTLGDAACFSFYPGKNLGAYGDAGAVVTDDAQVEDRVRRLANHGRTDKYTHSMIGFNHRLDGIQAAVLGVKLPHLDDWNAARRRAAKWYGEVLADTGLTLPTVPEGYEPVFHLYAVESDHRDALREALSAQGIGVGVHYPVPVHLQEAYAHLGYGPGSFPHSERLGERELSLPMFAELTREDVERVARAIQETLAKAA
jgi:dTDP-4-amino-4,6-dideoxygalactose transaminase